MFKTFKLMKQVDKDFQDDKEKYGCKVPPVERRRETIKTHNELYQQPLFRYIISPIARIFIAICFYPEVLAGKREQKQRQKEALKNGNKNT